MFLIIKNENVIEVWVVYCFEIKKFYISVCIVIKEEIKSYCNWVLNLYDL